MLEHMKCKGCTQLEALQLDKSGLTYMKFMCKKFTTFLGFGFDDKGICKCRECKNCTL